MKAFMRLTITEFKLVLRNFIYVFFAFIFPPAMLLLFGSMFGDQPSDMYGAYRPIDMMTPGYMGMIIAVCGVMGLPLQLAEYRQRKVLKRFKATPLDTTAIMLPQFIVNFILCISGIILLILIGWLVFSLQFWGSALLFGVALLVSVAALFSMGFLIAAVAPNGRAASAIAYMVYFPMLFLSGATMPLEMMPKAIVSISKALPLTYCVEVLKGTWMGQHDNLLVPFLILIAVTLVCVLVSARLFRWE